MQNRSFCPATSPTSVVAVEYYYILIIIIVVGPGAWLSHSAAEGYRFFSIFVTTLARNAGPPICVVCCLSCVLPRKLTNPLRTSPEKSKKRRTKTLATQKNVHSTMNLATFGSPAGRQPPASGPALRESYENRPFCRVRPLRY